MSDPVKAAEANVEKFRNQLNAVLEPHFGYRVVPVIIANIEGLILAHIQKTIADMMGKL